MKPGTLRAILRSVHLIVTIPILGYIYGKPSEVEQYAGGPRYIFVPLIIFTGYWMYAGMIFAVIGAAAWLGAIHFSGFGAAVLSQLVLLVARKSWLVVRARQARRATMNTADAGPKITTAMEQPNA
jgi:hypothetical protein